MRNASGNVHMKRDLVLVGVITGAHGIRGEVKLRSFTAHPTAIASYAPLETTAGAKLEILRMRAQKDDFIASLKGVTDRSAAEALKGRELFVPRARLPEPEAGEVYVHDLIGREVRFADGSVLGKILGTANYGAGELIDVRLKDRADSVLIPLAPPFLVTTDEGAVVVDLPEGWLDLKEAP
jgi:16S rRNA processing protein RimM